MGAIGLSVVLQLVVIYVPFLNSAFGTTPLGPWAWVECICLAAVVLIASEIYKAIMRAIDRKRGIMHNNAISLHRQSGLPLSTSENGSLLMPRNR